jgi:hypothetical protein
MQWRGNGSGSGHQEFTFLTKPMTQSRDTCLITSDVNVELSYT